MHRRAAVLPVVLAAVVTGLLSPAGPAKAVQPPPVLRILGPVAGDTVSREVTVVAELTVGASHPALSVGLGMAGRYVEVPVAADACIAPCEVRATIDSLGASPSDPGWADGPGTVRATVVVAGVLAQAAVGVQVANHRPSATEVPHVAGLPRPSVGWRPVGDVLPLAFGVRPGPQGHEVVSVEWVSGTRRAPLVQDGDRWTLLWPLDHVAVGRYASGHVVVTDADGSRAYSHGVHVQRVAGPVVTGVRPDADVQAGRAGRIAVEHVLPEYPQPATVADVQVVVDGATVPVLSRTVPGPVTAPSSGTVQLEVGPLPAGPGAFQVVLTDSTGRKGTAGATWPIRPTPRITIDPVELVDGQAGRVRATVSAPGAVIRSWTVTLGHQHVATSTACPCGPSARIDVPATAYAPGPVDLRVFATVEHPGGTTVEPSATRSVTVRPYLPATPFVAVSPGRSGADSILTRKPDGSLSVYEVNGKEMGDFTWTRTSGWRSMRDLVSVGDLDGDALADVYARTPSGDLYRYEVQGQSPAGMSAVFARGKAGHGWSGFRDLHGPGDWNGDGRADLLARDTAGRLWMYPGTGTGTLRPPVLVGTGWTSLRTILTPGDWNGDGPNDLMAIDSAGRMWLLPGNGRGGFLPAATIGRGWGGMNAVVGAGSDLGMPDTAIYARDGQGRFWRYQGTGTGGVARVTLLTKTTGPWY